MTYLITGGAGFIGSHLAEALIAGGDKVLVLDDLSTGSVENLAAIRTHPSLQCFFESVMERRLLAELVDQSDVIFLRLGFEELLRVRYAPSRPT